MPDRDKIPPHDFPEPVWTYRGYELEPKDFTNAMVHFFRAEVSRANVWRQRLDTTTNWAVITTAAIITFVFGSHTQGIHSVIILNTLLVTLFLFIETRRYRYYELWSYRVRLMETDFFASMLVPPFHPPSDWAESVAENLLHPSFPISRWEAFGRRYRRNYLWLYLLLSAVWALKLGLHPATARSWEEFIRRAAVGTIPGEIILIGGILFNAVMLTIGLATSRLSETSGEVLTHYVPSHIPRDVDTEDKSAWFRHGRKRKEYISLIITSQHEEVAAAIMKSMKRGVTQIHATGMFSGESRPILLCATTSTELKHLKEIVGNIDSDGFVVISPAQEIRGKGFSPLSEAFDN